jgi:regulator of protease activity HflC (stomatin/prohibitin superfamily)
MNSPEVVVQSKSILSGLTKKWPLWLGIFALLFLINATFVQIQYGTVGVVTRFGRVMSVMEPGLNIKIPVIDNVVRYRTQKVIYETAEVGAVSNADYQDYPVDTTTSDGQQISLRYTVRFSIDPEKVISVANNLGTESEVVEKIVKTDSRIYARTVPRSYKAIDLYSGNIEEVQEEIGDVLRPIFEENGLILDEFGIRSINFQPEYISAVEEKQIESERVTTEEYRAEQEKFRKEAEITKAQGAAEAQRLQQQTLTPELIQKMWIEKWNGTLPSVVGDGDGLILDIGDAANL